MEHFRLTITNIRRILWVLLIILVTGTVALAVGHWVTHGRLVIKAPTTTTLSSVTYCSGSCSAATVVTGDTAIVPSGSYIVQVNLNNNTSYVANVTVEGFFRSTVVEPKSKKYSLSVVATATNQYVLPIGDSLLTYDPDSSSYTTGGALAIPKLTAAQYVSAHELILIEYRESPEESNSELGRRVFVYNNVTKSLTEIGTVSGIDAASILHGNGALYAVRSTTQGSSILTLAKGGVSETHIPGTVAFAKNSTLPIVSVSDQYIAVLSGNDYYISQGDDRTGGGTNQSLLTIFDKSFHKIRDIQLGVRSDISSISLSPDSTAVVVVGERSITAYNTATGEAIFTTDARSSNAVSLLWRDNNSFIYRLGVGGIYLTDLKNKESYSILDNSMLRITDISAIVADKVYLTAFPNQSGNYDHTEPDGYVINLANDVSNQPAVDDTSITRSLPYNAMTYSIGYHFDQDAQVVIDVAADTGARNSAIGKLADLGFDPGDYVVVFKDYTNPFVTQTGEKK